jgi:diguanylate cyclase (GGDEF)-like protein/PAS domain S-box-containing protein
LLLFCAFTPAIAAQSEPLEQVRLQLKWRHQFQFAGYYAAIEQGYYRDAGLEVTLFEPAAGEEPVEAREMRRLIQPDLIEPGYMHAGRWQHIADTYASFGMPPADMPLDRFLYAPNPALDLTWFYLIAFSGFLLAGLSGGVGLYVQGLRRRAETAAARYRAVYEAAPLAFVVFDKERRVLDWNRRAELMFGWRREEVLGRDLREFLLPDDAKDEVEEVIRDTLGTGGRIQSRNWNLTRAGGPLLCEWINSTIHNPDDESQRLLALGLDITERVRLEQQLKYNAHLDALTGLANRAIFMRRLHQAIANAASGEDRFALLFLDLDGFKLVNDGHDHPCGDELLKFVGKRLGEIADPNVTIGRLGGDEFALLLPGIGDAKTACRAAEPYLRAFDEPLLLCGARQRLGASIGIALAPQHGLSADALLASADSAMYRAKRDGGNRQVVAEDPGKNDP